MTRAERWQVPPWEPFDGMFGCKSSRAFWIACDVILQNARARHQVWQDKKQTPEV